MTDDSYRWGRHTSVPIFGDDEEVNQIMVTSIDITELVETQQRLEDSLTKVLDGFVTICSYCKNIKDEEQQWLSNEVYAAKHMDFHEFSHGLCPTCYENLTDQKDLKPLG